MANLQQLFANGSAVISNAPSEALQEGRAFVADTTEFNVSSAARILFENQSFDKAAVVFAIASNSDTSAVPELFRDPTVNTPTTEREVMNLNFGSDRESECTIWADDGDPMEAGDGEALGVQFSVTSDYTIYDYAAVIPPQTSIGFTTESGGLSDSDVKMSLFYYEKDVYVEQ